MNRHLLVKEMSNSLRRLHSEVSNESESRTLPIYLLELKLTRRGYVFIRSRKGTT
jgi:hypothetical protein